MSKSKDQTDKRLLNQFMVRQAHKSGIPIDFLAKEAQEKVIVKINNKMNSILQGFVSNSVVSAVPKSEQQIKPTD